jgi:hypothetical protein
LHRPFGHSARSTFGAVIHFEHATAARADVHSLDAQAGLNDCRGVRHQVGTMSYDINIWSVSSIGAVREALKRNGFAEGTGGGFYLEGGGWQIAAYVHPVEDEDVPDEVMAQLAGIDVSIQMSLEPGSAPPSAHTRLRKIARLISRQTTGVIEDGQEGSYELATGVKKYLKPEREKRQRFSILKLSWWFESDLLATRERLYDFIGLLSRYLPEALPRRYGLFEPPQFTFKETGKDHFVDFLAAHRHGVVCYPSKPVWGIYFGLNPKSGFTNNGMRRKYKCSYLDISIDAVVLEQEHWQRHLNKTWKVISQALRPFYGDVRILKNYIGGRATYSVDATTQQHPVKVWWWRGVPSRPAQAVVIGAPYLRIWDDLPTAGVDEDGLYFISARKWSDEETVESMLKVPKALAQPESPKAIFSAAMIRDIVGRIKKGGAPPVTVAELPPNFPFADANDAGGPATAD